MLIEKFAVGPLETNCYIVSDEESKEALIIDPGDEPDLLVDYIKGNDLILKYIVCTHCHFDHIAVLSDIKEATEASVVIHKDDLDLYNNIQKQGLMWGFELEPLPVPDKFVSNGDILTIGKSEFIIIHTPGHSPGGLCLLSGGILFSGDTLFYGSVGRTDLPGGDIEKLKKSFKELMKLPEETIVMPGHGPETTIGKEKVDNFFSFQL